MPSRQSTNGRDAGTIAPAEDVSSFFGDVTPIAARKILIAATEAFARNGFHGTSTRDIGVQAGMSPAAVYIHFVTKEELLYQIGIIGHRRALETLDAAARKSADPVQQLQNMVSRFAAWHAVNHRMARIVQYEMRSLAPHHFAEVVVLRHATEAVLLRVLRAGVRSGAFRLKDLPGTSLAILSLCIDVARWYHPGSQHSPEWIGRTYADLAVRMTGADHTV
jgi:AcrR family transcriptional regulator